MTSLPWRVSFRWRFYEPIVYGGALHQRDSQYFDAIQYYRDHDDAAEAMRRFGRLGAADLKMQHV